MGNGVEAIYFVPESDIMMIAKTINDQVVTFLYHDYPAHVAGTDDCSFHIWDAASNNYFNNFYFKIDMRPIAIETHSLGGSNNILIIGTDLTQFYIVNMILS